MLMIMKKLAEEERKIAEEEKNRKLKLEKLKAQDKKRKKILQTKFNGI